jgi:hypothetical protein
MRRPIALLLAFGLLAACWPCSAVLAEPAAAQRTPAASWTTWVPDFLSELVSALAGPETPAGSKATVGSSQAPTPPEPPVALPATDPGQAITTTNEGEAYPEFDPNS